MLSSDRGQKFETLSGAAEALRNLDWSACLMPSRAEALAGLLGGAENIKKAAAAQDFIHGQFAGQEIATDLHMNEITGRAAIGIYTRSTSQGTFVAKTLARLPAYDSALRRYVGPEITLDVVIFVGKEFPNV